MTAPTHQPMLTTDLPGLTRLHQGKVRDVYALPPDAEGDRLLLVATDLSKFWYDRTSAVVPSAFIAVLDASNAAEFGVTDPAYFGRSMVMRRGEVMKVECVVRGYLVGSGWKEYQEHGVVCGVPLPAGLRMADRLLEPIFTPSTKAEPPAHDAPMTYEEVEALVGVEQANAIKLRSLALYRYGASACAERGILVADTKFEFGLINGEPTLIDEVMTPDSSRFWPANQYEPGRDQPSFDKQPLRDWLEAQGWDKRAPGPTLPDEVVAATSERYLEAYRRITGEDLPD